MLAASVFGTVAPVWVSRSALTRVTAKLHYGLGELTLW